jgi:type IV pilus assembly protein PilX
MKPFAVKSSKRTAASAAPAARQRGVVMFVALAVLILMTLAGLAMLRQMGGSVAIAGNLAFKQNATAVGDIGTETARAMVMTPSFDRTNTNAAAGYYSSWKKDDVDPASYFTDSALKVTPIKDDATGNTITYVVHRLCDTPNLDANDPAQRCSRSGDSSTTNKGVGGEASKDSSFLPYFRITTRVAGPRNTVSYIQVVMN